MYSRLRHAPPAPKSLCPGILMAPSSALFSICLQLQNCCLLSVGACREYPQLAHHWYALPKSAASCIAEWSNSMRLAWAPPVSILRSGSRITSGPGLLITLVLGRRAPPACRKNFEFSTVFGAKIRPKEPPSNRIRRLTIDQLINNLTVPSPKSGF